jgi:hypothetical protein
MFGWHPNYEGQALLRSNEGPNYEEVALLRSVDARTTKGKPHSRSVEARTTKEKVRDDYLPQRFRTAFVTASRTASWRMAH